MIRNLDLPTTPEFAFETASRTAIPITKLAVALRTAAARVRPGPTRWWIAATRVVMAGVRMPAQYPPRRRYLDDAVMAREMHRL